MSDRPGPNPIRSRQAAKRFRRQRKRLARRLSDEAYAEYLRGLTPRANTNNSNNDNNSNNSNNDNNNDNHSSIVSVPSPPPPPSPQLHSPNQLPSPPRSLTTPSVGPDSPHSTSTLKLFPDSPPLPPSIRSYSPISSPEEPSPPISPANFASSVEFIDEIRIPSPRPRHYYYYDPHQSLDNLILQFPQRITPLPPGSYSMGQL